MNTHFAQVNAFHATQLHMWYTGVCKCLKFDVINLSYQIVVVNTLRLIMFDFIY